MSNPIQFGTTPISKTNSSKLASGRNWRKYLRILNIAELEAQLYSDTEIALYIGVTPAYVSHLKTMPEMVQARITASQKTLSHTAQKALETVDDRRSAMDDMVPEALFAIRDAIRTGAPAIKLKAAQDLLDRQGDLAKISKTQIDIPRNFDYEEHDRTANDLLSALQNINSHRKQVAKADEEAGELEEVAGEEDISGVKEFTTASLDKDGQKKMQQAMELINELADLPENQKYVN